MLSEIKKLIKSLPGGEALLKAQWRLRDRIKKSLIALFAKILSCWGYSVEKKPRILISQPKKELKVRFSDVIKSYLLEKKPVYFIQIGACDGKMNDPIYDFVTEYDWHGVLVEPIADLYKELRANYGERPNLLFKNVAIAEERGKKTLYKVRDDGSDDANIAKMLPSFCKETVLRHRYSIPNIDELLEEEEVECITLGDLFDEVGVDQIDLMQIDTEGYDYNILKMLDFSKYKPSVIHFEHSHLNEDDKNECLEMLVEQGYQIALEPYDVIAFQAKA